MQPIQDHSETIYYFLLTEEEEFPEEVEDSHIQEVLAEVLLLYVDSAH